MPELPSGTVTFLFTDVEGSTRLWEEHPRAMKVAMARHDAILREAVEANSGAVFRTVGDGVCAAFATAPQSVEAALAGQLALRSEPWGGIGPLRVRMALHTGAAEVQGGDYVGACLNRVARLLGIGHGGQVLLSMATEELIRDDLPRGASLRALGEQRLRDLTRAERVYQLVHPELPADFPALRSLDAYPSNLPLQLTSFVGRERETAEVKRLLGEHRLVTLTGTGGCGKTRLALQVAADLLDEYPDGIWVVELAPVSDPALVARSVAYVLGISEEPGQPVVAALASYLRPKRALLVIDNCEHLIDACAHLVEALLRTCSHLEILVTSRELLGVPGEVAYQVPSLATPDPRELPPPVEIARFEAVRLLVERARLVRSEYALTEQNAGAVAAICSRLDGIPLALELAAARLSSMTAEQVAARLTDRFRLLTGGSRTALRRQQTLRAAIDWSHNLLAEPERLILRRLAVFSGGCTLEAAERVCSGEGVEAWEVADLLGSLVRKSLVMAEDTSGEERYRLLETVRQYAGEKLLDAGEADGVRARHRDWCLALVEQADAGVNVEVDDWMERLEAEHDNLRAALAWCLETDARSGLELASALGGSLFWYLGAYFAEGHRWLSELLVRAPADLAPRVKGMALFGVGLLARGLGEVAEARQSMEEGMRLLRQVGDRRWTGWAAYQLALTALTRGDLAEAEELYEEARQAWSGAEFASWTPGVDVDLAILRLRRGELGSARDLLERAARALRAAGPRHLAAYCREYLGYLTMVDGDPEAARTLLEESLAYYRARRRWPRVCMTLHWLCLVALAEDEPGRARALLAEALGVARRIGSRPLVVASLLFGAVLAEAQGAYAKVGCLLGAAHDELPLQAGAGGQAISALLVRGRARAVEASARAVLGDESFAKTWAEGEAMTLEEAVECALAEGGAD